MKIATGITLGTMLIVSGTVSAGVSNVIVSNTGDQSLSLIRCVTSKGKTPISCWEKERMNVGFGASWPANQYDGHPAWWWTGLRGEVIGVKAKSSLKPLKKPGRIVRVNTSIPESEPGADDGKNSGSNFSGISPDGRTLWNSAREVDLIQEIDTDPDSPTFGTILHEIQVPDQDPTTPATDTRGAAGPCDATITPDGRFFLEPDLYGESLTVVDIQAGHIIHQVLPERAFDERVQPFMATTNGRIVLVENLEGPNTYDIWDVSVLPAEPIHLKKLTAADNLGINAQTSEFTPDGRFAYLIMSGMGGVPADDPKASRIDVLDVVENSPTFLQIVGHIELPAGCRASTGDFSNDGRFFFVNCRDRDEIGVIDNDEQMLVTTIPVGAEPRGIVVR